MRLQIHLNAIMLLLAIPGIGSADEAEQKVIQTLKAKLAEKDAVVTQLAATLESLTARLKKQEEQVESQKVRLQDLEQKTREYKAQAIKYQVDYQSAMDRNEKLVNRMRELEMELGRARGAAAPPPAKNPPGISVKGSIKSIDKTSGYLTIDIGSDQGLAKGHTLEVYRLGAKPIHVATIRILESREKESVGRAIASTSAVQVSDKVVDQFPPKE